MTTAGASPPLGSDQHLPDKARTVMEKFAAYKRTASTAEIEAKRQQVIAYLDRLLKDEAAAANLDGALALRALIDRVADGDDTPPAPSAATRQPIAKPRSHAEPDPPSAAPSDIGARSSSPSPTRPPSPSARATPLPTTAGSKPVRFSIRDDAARTLHYSFEVGSPALPTSSTVIALEISGAADDSGDGGLHFTLTDPAGRAVRGGFLDDDGLAVRSLHTHEAGVWTLVLEDADTSLHGESPGNSGTLRITVWEDSTHPVLARGTTHDPQQADNASREP